MVPAQINYWAVLVSAIGTMAIGALWYSPRAFGKQWQELLGINHGAKQTSSQMAKLYLNSFVAFLVMDYILAHFVDYVGATTVAEGIVTGIWVWLGFVATVTLINSWFEQRPVKLWLINAGYFLVALIFSGAILATWS